ncbi:Short-chain dehydrogenase/reductase family protein [Mycena venus]|uniref:Short-chain dehydrogenase/reductase family protein n=1 Tax=Mycena venus TaxID=2733690 RepID=A0A8H6YBW2_9AGAR|nr:Short-chain dehydrogenase/reductase family protein [Mycena venus]
MDAPLHPPLRIDALSTKPLSSKSTQKRLEAFLQDFQDRTTAAQSGHTAVTVQVQKLKDALKDEREAVKAVSKSS